MLDTKHNEEGWDLKAMKYDAAHLRLKHNELITSTRRGRKNKKMDQYTRAVTNGLLPLINMVGLDGYKLGDNVIHRGMENPLPSSTLDGLGNLPYDQYVGTSYRTEADVRRALISALAKKVSTIREVREFAERKIFLELHLTTQPTKKGQRLIIDSSHEFFVVHSLRNKPLLNFVNRPGDAEQLEIENGRKWDQKLQYLVLCRAENEKMISVEYSGVYKDIILKRLHTVCTDESTSLESEVNAVRLAVMDEATERYCIPEAINAMRDDALRASREHLIELCGDKLWNRASEDLSWMREIKLDERVTNLLKRMQTEQMEQRKLDRRNAASASMYDSDDEYSNMRGGDEEYEMEGEGSGVQIGARYRRDGCLFLPPRGVKGMGKPIFVNDQLT